jgi:hypothetical protein
MFCDRCGTPFNAGITYCGSCGKQLAAAPPAQRQSASRPAAAQALPVARPRVEGRVLRNLNIVAGLWLASGVLRVMAFGGLLIARRFFCDSGWNWPGRWPFGNSFGFSPLFLGGIISAGVFTVMFGAGALLVAWGLHEKQPWARILGIVLAFLSLLRFPFGTALGIYTLWVLLPETSAREYDGIAGVSGQANAPGYSR